MFRIIDMFSFLTLRPSRYPDMRAKTLACIPIWSVSSRSA